MVRVTKKYISSLTENSIDSMDVDTLTKIIRVCNKAYHAEGVSLVGDDFYDHCKDVLLEKDPTNSILSEVGSNCKTDKVTLPFWMGSMDKIKNDVNALDKWIKTYGNEVIITDKLDGISALCIKRTDKFSLFTRGNGYEGQDITKIIPYIRGLEKAEGDFIVRGELIMTKTNFKDLIEKEVIKSDSNARNVVAGVINSKNPKRDILERVDFVAYELIDDQSESSLLLTPFEQLSRMQLICKLNIANTISTKTLDIECLTSILKNRKKESVYEIDGIVVYQEGKNERNTSGNPSYAFAFKLPTEVATVVVTNIQWNVSKDKYLNPVVCFEPVYLNGVTINKASGFNAKFIVDNKINTGAQINITRSGEVIPHIENVEIPSDSPGLPKNVEYYWNATNVDILLKGDNNESKFKSFENMIRKLEVYGLGGGMLKKLYDNEINCLDKLMKVNKGDLLKIPNIKEKSANNILVAIEDMKQKLSIKKLMVASNIFGRGIGPKLIESIMKKYPDILIDKTITINDLIRIDGIERKTATLFHDNIDKFNEFIHNNHLEEYVSTSKETNIVEDKAPKTTKLKDHVFVFSGFRNDSLEKSIKENGGSVENSMKRNVTHLIVKDPIKKTSKYHYAMNNNICIVNDTYVKKIIY